MKPDERELWLLLAGRVGETPSVRELNAAGPRMHWKRLAAVLQKWVRRGLYEYGVNVELGWLTEAGAAFARSVAAG